MRPSSPHRIAFSSVQDGIYALGKALMRSTLSLGSFPSVPLKRFQCSSDWRWPSLVYRFLFPRLSPPCARCCDFLGFMPAGSVSSFSTLHIFRETSHLWGLLCPPVLATLSARLFPFTPTCPGRYTYRCFRRWISTIDTFQAGLPISLFTFCSKFTESVRMIAWVGWLSALEAIQRRSWVAALDFITRLTVKHKSISPTRFSASSHRFTDDLNQTHPEHWSDAHSHCLLYFILHYAQNYHVQFRSLHCQMILICYIR